MCYDNIFIEVPVDDNSSRLCVFSSGYRNRNGSYRGLVSLKTESKNRKKMRCSFGGRGVQFENKDVMRCGFDKRFGLYVHCIKDKT